MSNESEREADESCSYHESLSDRSPDDTSILFPDSPEPISPTLGSALAPIFPTITRQHQSHASSVAATPFPFPDFLPPSSELPLLEIEMDDLTAFSEDFTMAEYSNGEIDGEKRKIQQRSFENINRIANKSDYKGIFSQMIYDNDERQHSIPHTNNLPFNVLLSGHDYTNKMESKITRLRATPANFQPPFLNHSHNMIIPPSLNPISSTYGRQFSFPQHRINSQLALSSRPIHFPIMGPGLQNIPAVYQNTKPQNEKVPSNRGQDKDEDKVFQCTYANCGKMYAKSSHLKVGPLVFFNLLELIKHFKYNLDNN